MPNANEKESRTTDKDVKVKHKGLCEFADDKQALWKAFVYHEVKLLFIILILNRHMMLIDTGYSSSTLIFCLCNTFVGGTSFSLQM